MLPLVSQIRFSAACAGADILTSSEISLYVASHLAHFANTAPSTFCLVYFANRGSVFYKSLVRIAVAETWYACSKIPRRSSTSSSSSRPVYAIARSSFDDILSTFLPFLSWKQFVRLWRRALTPRPKVSVQLQPCYSSYQLKQFTRCSPRAVFSFINRRCLRTICYCIGPFQICFDNHINTFTNSTVLVSTSAWVTVIQLFTRTVTAKAFTARRFCLPHVFAVVSDLNIFFGSN